MTMFTLREAAALIPGAVVIGDENVAIERVSTDSRKAQAGDLFVAVKGDRFDAHDFLTQVAERGTSAALVSRVPADAVPAGHQGKGHPRGARCARARMAQALHVCRSSR